jgi:hypothetical protein
MSMREPGVAIGTLGAGMCVYIVIGSVFSQLALAFIQWQSRNICSRSI